MVAGRIARLKLMAVTIPGPCGAAVSGA
jgi:hypothetical protein